MQKSAPLQTLSLKSAPLKSALPRTIDLSNPSNRYAAGGFVAGVLLSRVLGRPWKQALGDGLAGFAGWATARELDPDHTQSATIALPLALGAALLGGTPNPLGSFTAMSGLRVLAGTVGHAPTALDTMALMAQAILAAGAGERVAAAVLGVSLGLSAARGDQFSPAPEGALVGAAALLPSRDHSPKRSVVSDLLSLAALGTYGVLTRPETVTSKCDQTPAKVADERIELARKTALGTLAAGLLLRQTRSLAPLAAAVLSVGWRRLSE